jgi:hypothetical protein
MKPNSSGGRTCGCLILRRGLTAEVGRLQTVNYSDSRNRAGLSDTHACSPVPPFWTRGRVTNPVGGCERYGDISPINREAVLTQPCRERRKSSSE